MTERKTAKRTVNGRVVSNRMDKTVTIVVERLIRHSLYGKYIRRSTKLHAHDEDNSCQLGDWVAVEECRPMSKIKSWRLVKIIERAAE
ncbi:30S ribosomal protein S17 [Nitrococcus mobilis]|nr:30S ribosomal protein S17 [Nitrococcus mobilis]